MSNRRRLNPPPLKRLPCGCQFGTAVVDGERTFLIRPCSLICETYRYAIDESKRQGKPVKVR